MKLSISRFSIVLLVTVVVTVTSGVDLSAQPSIQLAGRWAEGPTYAVEVEGERLYYGRGGYLVVADISGSARPRELGRLLLPGVVQDVRVSGRQAYVAAGDGGFHVVDVADAARPSLLARVESPLEDAESGPLVFGGGATQVEVAGDTAYVVFAERLPNWSDELYAVDVYDPVAPSVRRRVHPEDNDVAYDINSVAVSEGQVFVTGWDVTNVYSPDSTALGRGVDSVCQGPLVARGDYMLCVSGSGIEIYELSDPAEPVLVSQAAAADGLEPFSAPREVTIASGFAYVVSDGNDGHDPFTGESFDHGFLSIYDVRDVASPTGVRTIEIGHDPVDVAVRGDAVFTAAAHGGLKVFDASDKAAPSHVATVPAIEQLRLAGSRRDVAYVYEAEEPALHVIDVADAELPRRAASLEFSGAVAEAGMGGDYVVVVTRDSLLHVVDVQNRAAPRIVGSTRAVPGRLAVRPGAAFVRSGQQLFTFDVRDPVRPSLKASLPYTSETREMIAKGEYLYLFSEDCGSLSSCTVLDVVDVATLSRPVRRGSLELAGGLSTHATTTTVDGEDYIVAATFRRSSTNRTLHVLDVVDATDPDAPTIVGTYDLPAYVMASGLSALDDGTIALLGGAPSAYSARRRMLYRFAWDKTGQASWTEAVAVPGDAAGVAAAGDRVYVATDEHGLVIYTSGASTTAFEPPQASEAEPITAHPNPFSERTRIAYVLDRPQRVRLHVYDVTGRRVATLVDEWQQGGEHVAVLKTDGMASAVYVYRLQTDEGVTTGKMLLVK